MRFAVIANIQGNVDALTAVLDAIAERHKRLESVICAGDLVGLGPNPNEVISLLRERNVAAVRGNYDDAVALGRDESGTDFATRAEEDADARAVRWTRGQLTDEDRDYLADLPRDLRLSPGPRGVKAAKNQADERQSEYRRTFFIRTLMGGWFRGPVRAYKRVLVMHGTPRALNEFVREETAASILRAVARDTQADVLVTAHAGTTFRRDAEGVTFIGAGSVSGPAAEPGLATYTIVDTAPDIEVQNDVVRYDPSRYLHALQELGLPPARRPTFHSVSGSHSQPATQQGEE